MVNFVIRRLFSGLVVVFVIAWATFAMMHAAPGGPFDERKLINNPEIKQNLNEFFGLDKPAYFNTTALRDAWQAGERNPRVLGSNFFDSQFFTYMGNAVHFDLGPSYTERGKHVQDILVEHWQYSIYLGACALVIALVVGVPFGIIASLTQNSWIDHTIRFIATLGVSVPVLVTGLLALYVGTNMGWLTITGNNWNTLQPYLIPGSVLGIGTMSFVIRLIRTEVLDVRRHDYIRTAYAKGLSRVAVVQRHMVPNILIPVITWLGPEVVALFTGAIITETIFGVPGIGTFFVESIEKRDYSMIMGTTLLYATLIVLASIVVDVCAKWLDPRITID